MMLQAVLLPVFVQVALTFALLFWTGGIRTGAVRRGEVRVRDIALRQPNWPARPTQIANAYQNQLELPLLFYVLVILALFTKQADFLFVALSWVFVLSRVVHAAIFVTSNRVSQRFLAFLVGAVVLLVMWLIFAVRILTAV